ncbi:hypothetical protein PGT21_028880 [Puccinia graminis f. sp. tritici]|uniref:CigA protein n=1 Tax=Puccinia graminis f. sp. tritici TaxID=56615 RepID=A0A5B0QBR7_PUCGR|nr:hypothetical protein PGT21_028880 [Puccinia graminis f. sp. tritici]
MRNQNLPSHHQSKGSASPEDASLRSTPLRSLKKRTSRRLVVIIALIASIVALLRYSPRAVLYTWTAQHAHSDPQLGWSSVKVNVKGASRDWTSESYETTSASFNNYYNPKTALQVDEALSDREPTRGSQIPSSRVDQVVDHFDTEPKDAQGFGPKEVIPIFERLVVKEAPSTPYKPLPRMRLQPDLRYEDVWPNVHRLTRELESTKFLTFSPHSGFHNQRIEIKNAFKIAKLLNRTLILPSFRLGNALGWGNSTSLSAALEQAETKYDRLSECLNLLSKVHDSHIGGEKSDLLKECRDDSKWTSVQVDYMLDIKDLYKEVPIIDRTDLREAWLWDTLKLERGEWLEVKDDFRYSYQIYESATTSSVAESKYEWRLNIADLADFSDTRLLSFGSLFGSERVILSSPEMEKFNQKIESNQFLNLPLLEKISDRIADRLGGRGNYIGLHLRVADAFFKVQAPQVIRETFDKICKEILKVDQKTINDLIAQYESNTLLKTGDVNDGLENLQSALHVNRQSASKIELSDLETSHKSGNRHLKYESRGINKETSGIAPKSQFLNPTRNGLQQNPSKTLNRKIRPSFTCNRKLYQDQAGGQLEKLNVPIYISTDVRSKSIKNEEVLRLIFESFPCVFSSNNLKTIKPKGSKRVRKPNNRGLIGRKNSNSQGSGQTRTESNAQQATIEELQRDFSPHHDAQDEEPENEDDEDLYGFHLLKSNLDGVSLDRFLFPVLESMIVSKGSHIIGTPRSTFSNYVETVLHPIYHRSSKSTRSGNRLK